MKHTIKGYLSYRTADYYTEQERIRFTMYDPRAHGDAREVFIAEHSIEVDIPDDFDPREQMVSALRAERKKVQAEFSMKVKELDDRINSLLALEMSE